MEPLPTQAQIDAVAAVFDQVADDVLNAEVELLGAIRPLRWNDHRVRGRLAKRAAVPGCAEKLKEALRVDHFLKDVVAVTGAVQNLRDLRGKKNYCCRCRDWMKNGHGCCCPACDHRQRQGWRCFCRHLQPDWR